MPRDLLDVPCILMPNRGVDRSTDQLGALRMWASAARRSASRPALVAG
jgi:hypothetical protein